MINYDATFESEIYRECLNDMYAKISEFLYLHPYNCFHKALIKKREDVSIAYKQSRFFCDKGHFELWENLLLDVENLLKEANEGS